MFVIIPLIIIFLCSSYLYLNDVSFITTSFIYSFEVILIFSTFKLYKKVQDDMELQEENKIKEEIFELNQKLKNSSDKVVIKSTQHKIENLKKELHH